jgi:hypothetical protein
MRTDPPPLKWSDLRYVFDIQEDCNGKGGAVQPPMRNAGSSSHLGVTMPPTHRAARRKCALTPLRLVQVVHKDLDQFFHLSI